MTALHGAVICNQPSILQYLVDQGANLNAKNTAGWTPLMITKGIFMANSKKEFPVAARDPQEGWGGSVDGSGPGFCTPRGLRDCQSRAGWQPAPTRPNPIRRGSESARNRAVMARPGCEHFKLQ